MIKVKTLVAHDSAGLDERGASDGKYGRAVGSVYFVGDEASAQNLVDQKFVELHKDEKSSGKAN